MGRRRLAAAIISSYFTLASNCPPNFAQEATPPDPAHVAAAELAINEQALRGHIRFLASDLLEGRGPGSRGDVGTDQFSSQPNTNRVLTVDDVGPSAPSEDRPWISAPKLDVDWIPVREVSPRQLPDFGHPSSTEESS